jgi:hypothetical protein
MLAMMQLETPAGRQRGVQALPSWPLIILSSF